MVGSYGIKVSYYGIQFSSPLCPAMAWRWQTFKELFSLERTCYCSEYSNSRDRARANIRRETSLKIPADRGGCFLHNYHGIWLLPFDLYNYIYFAISYLCLNRILKDCHLNGYVPNKSFVFKCLMKETHTLCEYVYDTLSGIKKWVKKVLLLFN